MSILVKSKATLRLGTIGSSPLLPRENPLGILTQWQTQSGSVSLKFVWVFFRHLHLSCRASEPKLTRTEKVKVSAGTSFPI